MTEAAEIIEESKTEWCPNCQKPKTKSDMRLKRNKWRCTLCISKANKFKERRRK